jgi:hypothetical protein
MTTIRISLQEEAERMRSVLMPMLTVEAGLGADGVGHGRLKAPSEELLQNDAVGSEEKAPQG